MPAWTVYLAASEFATAAPTIFYLSVTAPDKATGFTGNEIAAFMLRNSELFSTSTVSPCASLVASFTNVC